MLRVCFFLPPVQSHPAPDATPGNPVDHQFAKEALVGLVGGEVDKLAETKGRDAWDRHEVKKHAQENAQRLYDDRYGGQPNFDPNYYN